MNERKQGLVPRVVACALGLAFSGYVVFIAPACGSCTEAKALEMAKDMARKWCDENKRQNLQIVANRFRQYCAPNYDLTIQGQLAPNNDPVQLCDTYNQWGTPQGRIPYGLGHVPLVCNSCDPQPPNPLRCGTGFSKAISWTQDGSCDKHNFKVSIRGSYQVSQAVVSSQRAYLTYRDRQMPFTYETGKGAVTEVVRSQLHVVGVYATQVWVNGEDVTDKVPADVRNVSCDMGTVEFTHYAFTDIPSQRGTCGQMVGQK